MKRKATNILIAIGAISIYIAALVCFKISYLVEAAEDIEMRNSAISISYYARSTYWDWIGIGLIVVTTILLVGLFLYWRTQSDRAMTRINVND